MTNLTTVARWTDAKAHLDALKSTIAGDIRPLLATPGSAPFAICREVFSYVDYVGALYTGKLGVRDRFTSVIRDLLSSVDANYQTRAEELYQMYRCGTVHQFKPKTLVNSAGQTLMWLNYRGPRAGAGISFRGRADTVTHLVPLRDPGATHAWLPVSSDCLVDDLESAIDVFTNDPNHAQRVAAWNASAPTFINAFRLEFTI